MDRNLILKDQSFTRHDRISFNIIVDFIFNKKFYNCLDQWNKCRDKNLKNKY